jgi:hypothetical protein
MLCFPWCFRDKDGDDAPANGTAMNGECARQRR